MARGGVDYSKKAIILNISVKGGGGAFDRNIKIIAFLE